MKGRDIDRVGVVGDVSYSPLPTANLPYEYGSWASITNSYDGVLPLGSSNVSQKHGKGNLINCMAQTLARKASATIEPTQVHFGCRSQFVRLKFGSSQCTWHCMDEHLSKTVGFQGAVKDVESSKTASCQLHCKVCKVE